MDEKKTSVFLVLQCFPLIQESLFSINQWSISSLNRSDKNEIIMQKNLCIWRQGITIIIQKNRFEPVKNRVRWLHLFFSTKSRPVPWILMEPRSLSENDLTKSHKKHVRILVWYNKFCFDTLVCPNKWIFCYKKPDLINNKLLFRSVQFKIVW